MGFFASAFDLLSNETFLAVASSTAKLATAGAAIYNAVQQKEIAQDRGALQQQEVLRQQRLSKLQASRQARIRTANILAQQGNSGVRASTAEAGVIGVQTDLASGFQELDETTAFNINQLGLQVADAETIANTGIATGIFTAGLELPAFANATGGFTDSLDQQNAQTTQATPTKRGLSIIHEEY